jgi:hypothetical protein
MTTSADPFFLPAGATPDLGARFVLPVRAGGEWLGSIWCAVSAPPEARVVADLVTMASAVALHLLDLRVQSDLTRRVWLDRLRQALLDPGAEAGAWLAAGPWRVVALLGSPTAATELGGEPDDSPAAPAVGPGGIGRSVDGRPPPPRVGAAGDRRYRRPSFRDRHRHRPPIRCLDVLQLGAAPPPEPAGHLGLATVGGRGVSRTREPRGDHRGHARRSRGRPHSLPRRGRGDSAIAERPRNHNCCGRGLLGSAGRVARGARAGRRLAPGSTRGPRRRSHDGGERSAYALGLARPPGSPRRAAEALGVHVNTIRYRMDRIAPLLAVDLADPEIRLALRLALRAN